MRLDYEQGICQSYFGVVTYIYANKKRKVHMGNKLTQTYIKKSHFMGDVKHIIKVIEE